MSLATYSPSPQTTLLSSPRRGPLGVCGLLPALLSLLLASTAMAQPQPAVQIVREKAFYVPFDKIEDVFNKTGKGIFLPYQKFLDLWNKANPENVGTENTPPTDAVLRAGTYVGTVKGDSAHFEVVYSIEALKKGWSEVRLLLSDVAVESAELSDDQALFSAVNGGYSVYLPRAGKYELKVRFAVGIAKQPGKKSFHFGIPAAAVSKLEVSIPEAQIRVDVSPSLAVTQTIDENDSSRVLAYLGNSSQVAVQWMPPVGRVSEDGAIFYSNQWIRTFLGERILKLATYIDYQVLRGEIDTFRVTLPSGTRLWSVEGENISEWNVDDAGVLNVKLHAAVGSGSSYQLTLNFERVLDNTPDTLSIPFPKTEDVLKEEGWVVLAHDPSLLVRVTNTAGLSQLDPESIPEALRQTPVRAGFRYLAHPLTLDVAIVPITPVVRAQTTSVVALGEQEDRWFGWIDYDIAKTGIFRLQFTIPSGWSVEEVGEPSTREDFQVTDGPDGAQTVAVSLRSKALGKFRLPFQLLRTGSARSGDVTFAPPRVLDVSQDRGLFGISTPPALDIVTRTRTQMVDADADEIVRTGLLQQLSSGNVMPRTFRYREQSASVALTLERRKTEIDVVAQHLIEVGSNHSKVTHFLDYNVLYAPVEQVRFLAPTILDEELQIQAERKTQTRRVSSANGMTLWEVSLQPPVLGGLTLSVWHELKYPPPAVGTPFDLPIPMVHATEVRTEQGFVAIRKQQRDLEIAPAATRMEGIDIGQLPDKLRRGQIYSSYRYFAANPQLNLQLTRYEYDPLTQTVVMLAHLKSVLSQECILKTKAWFLIQNNGSQFLKLNLGPNAEIFSIQVAGRTESNRRETDSNVTLIQLPQMEGVHGYWIEIEYQQRIADSTLGSLGAFSLQAPRFEDGVPVGKLELDLHVPNEYAYLSWSGTLHPRAAGESGLWGRLKGAAEADAPRTITNTRLPDGATINVPGNYRKISFDTLSPRGELTGVYVGWRLFWLFDFLVFLLVVAGMSRLVHRQSTRMARLRWSISAVLISGILAGFATVPTSQLFVSAFLGSSLLAAWVLLGSMATAWKERRRRNLALAPDPFLEEGPSNVGDRGGATPPASTDAPKAQETTPQEATEPTSPRESSKKKRKPSAEKKGEQSDSGRSSDHSGGTSKEGGSKDDTAKGDTSKDGGGSSS